MDIDHGGIDALGSQQLTGFDGGGDHNAGGKDHGVLAVAQHTALPQLKAVVGGIENDRHRITAKPEIDRSVVFQNRLDRSVGLGRVGGVHNRHVRQRAHQRQILAELVRRAVLPDGNAGVTGSDFHVQLRISDRVANLLIRAAAGEHCE